MKEGSMTFKHNCSTANASTFLDWIKNRGGVSVWKSIDLSDPGFSMSSPALDKDGLSYPKPHWKVENAPSLTVTSADDIEVHLDHEVKRFHVAIRRGAQGFSFKCTDASSRKIRKEVEKAGEGAYYFFDYFTQEAVIMAPEPGKSMALSDWAKMKEERNG
jgi:hypothetical protein